MALRMNFQRTTRCLRYSSTQAASISSPPPMLLKIREDMKTAMRAKDSLRLDVLRGLIAEATNAAKTPNPVNTDSRMLAIVKKRIKSSEGAIGEFEQAGRSDLQEKEAAQVSVLEEYVKNSSSLSEEDLLAKVQEEVGKIRSAGGEPDKGSVMRALIGPTGTLKGQLVDNKQLATLVDGII